VRALAAPRHTCDNPDWYTPGPILDRVRQVLGTIDLDPASDETANQLVRATRYYTEAEDGLKQPWAGRVFVNPPGRWAKLFWRKLVTAYLAGAVEEAIWIGYSLEQLQTFQHQPARITPLGAAALCIPRTRIHFLENAAMRAERLRRIDAINQTRRARGDLLRPRRMEADAPTHGNYLAYLGLRTGVFHEACRTLGQVVVLPR